MKVNTIKFENIDGKILYYVTTASEVSDKVVRINIGEKNYNAINELIIEEMKAFEPMVKIKK